ncbi:hypothetical protein [Clostridium sp.]|uniref:hypothetical protein n=1 Tax=Clostridium sp. TaxID=1506 RepID=UPI002621A702|nr:hypothetical protein [Clostridium sp.]
MGKLLGKYTNEFKVKIDTIFKDNKRNLIVHNREYRKNKKGENEKWYKYKCNKCGYNEGWVIEHSLLSGCGCSCCANRTIIENINSIVANTMDD